MKQTPTLNERMIALLLLLSFTPACPAPETLLTTDAGPGPVEDVDAGSVNMPRDDGGRTPEPPPGGSGPVDLLFVIDNSISMSDKQVLLRQAASDALSRFTSPPCVDAEGNQLAPPPPGGVCPAGQRRQFEPVTDLHVAVISTSLGDGGSEVACPSEGSEGFVADRVDMAHLIGSLPRGAAVGGDPAGFLSWRAGEDAETASQTFRNMLDAVGERGCGWEMPLEAWYRFLIDPEPYSSLERVACPNTTSTALNCVRPALDGAGEVVRDEVLLAQRRAFLRPNSRLAIVMLTDENDCSLAIGPQSWVVLDISTPRTFFRGSSACDTDPNSACCYSCPLGPPQGCADDPICSGDAENQIEENRLPDDADGRNLRCFQQKRRFGIDLLYPTARYVRALTEPLLCPSRPDLAVEGCMGALVQNPLFAGGRQPSDVFSSGIVGVPWQLLEAQQNVPGRPRVEEGFRYKLAGELGPADWLAMVGDSKASPPVPPSSPFMVESALPRSGVEPQNPINGREYDTASGSARPDDLQYACIFAMPVARDCTTLDPALQECACFEGQRDRPLCEERPGESVAGPIQHWAKAYPSTRQLEVLQALGQQSVVSSICARNVSDASAADYSYRPAIAALVDSMEPSLRVAP